MSDYSELSDFEINKRVRLAIGKSISYTDKGRVLVPCPNNVYRAFDPCNNLADAWPIIVDHEICVEFDASEDGINRWCNASSSDGELAANYHSNPLRAAMIVFLMMKEAE